MRPPDGWPWFAAIAVALMLAALIGIVQGMIITRFQLPSFVVTLAGFLVWNGMVLILIGSGGTVVIQDPIVIGLANSFLPAVWGWVVAVVIVALFAVGRVNRWRDRQRRGVSTTPLSILITQIVVMALLVALVVYFANQDRGVPFVGIILLILLTGFTFLAERTQFGRYVYAIGGNMEAARRAGISVNRIRVMVFMISSLMAGMGGIVLASRLRSVDTAAGGGNLLLNSIAGLSAGVKFVITGLVLLVAVLVDSLSRRSRSRSGLA